MGAQIDNLVLLSEIGQFDMSHLKLKIVIVGLGREDLGKKALGRSEANIIENKSLTEQELFKEYKYNYSVNLIPF